MTRHIGAFNDFKGLFQGFTLAEVLITLGIIGVVAALTLPALINDKQNKELEAKYKKVYSVMQQALLKMSYDEGQEITKENYNSPTKFLNIYRKYFIQYIPCSKGRCDGYSVAESGQNLSKIYKTFNGKASIDSSYFDDTNTVIADGIEIMTNGDYITYGINLTVDINGHKTKPNKWGYDLFTFQMVKGKLVPMGGDGTVYYNQNLTPDLYCNKNNSSSRNGLTCAAKALSDTNYFKNLPK